MPMQLDLDKGSEIGWQVAFQIALRCVCLSRSPMRSINIYPFSEAFAPQIDPDVYGSVALLKSIHNIIIEALWRWLREKAGYNLREIILHEVDYHRYVLLF